MAVLKKMVPGRTGEIIELREGIIQIGRGESCDVLLTKPAASKAHAAIECQETHCELKDLGSRNGTRVNGIRIKSSTPLRHRDILDFAGATYVYLETDEDASDDSFGSSYNLTSDHVHVLTPLPGDTDSEQSLDRVIVRAGDIVSPADLNEHPGVEGARVIAALDMYDLPLGMWSPTDAPRKLSHVLRLVQAITALDEPRQTDDVLPVLLDLFSSASHALIAINEESAHGFRIVAAISRAGSDAVFLCHPLIRRSISESEGLLVTDHWRNDSNEKPIITNLSRQSLLCVPIPGSKQTCQGVIQMQANDPRRPFTEPDLQRLAVLTHILGAMLSGFRHLT